MDKYDNWLLLIVHTVNLFCVSLKSWRSKWRLKWGLLSDMDTGTQSLKAFDSGFDCHNINDSGSAR
jgi:hypothetical protein